MDKSDGLRFPKHDFQHANFLFDLIQLAAAIFADEKVLLYGFDEPVIALMVHGVILQIIHCGMSFQEGCHIFKNRTKRARHQARRASEPFTSME